MIVTIQWTYKRKKGPTTVFTSEELQVTEAIVLAEDIEKTGRVKDLLFIDHQGRRWTLKEIKRYLKGIETEPHQIKVYFDGNFDLTLKKAGLGCVIYFEQNGKSWRIRKNAAVDEMNTNNEAEYAALHLSILELINIGVHHIPVLFSGDSQVVLNQLSGEWPCLEEALSKWADRVEDKLEEIGIEPVYEIVTRKNNKEADHLASQALNGVEIYSTIEK